MIVVDASVMLEVLLRTPAAAAAREALESGGALHCPHLLDVEVAQVLRRYVRSGELDAARAAAALGDLADFPLVRHPHALLLDRIWELRDNVTAYDAAYLALAEALDAPLVTRDARLAAAPGVRAAVRVF